jgi:hypothetical protein
MPPNLHGLKGPELFGGVYMSGDLLAAWRAGATDRIRWIVRNNQGIPDWASEGEVPASEIPFRTTDAGAQIVSVRQGFGMAMVPCFVGEAEPPAAHAGRDAQDLSAYGSSPSSYPAGSPRTYRFSRDCPIAAIDEPRGSPSATAPDAADCGRDAAA